MATSKKIIVVVGATGNQGSSVAHSFLNLPDWHVRCVTRKPSSSASLALASLGAEIVQADLSDALSLSKAFSDVNAIFVNTDFWEIYVASEKEKATGTHGKIETSEISSSEVAFAKEVLYGKNAALAAATVPTLERFVYSALPPMNKHSKGKYSAYHSDSKAAVVEYILKEEPDLAKKTSFIYLGAYNTNALLSPRLDPASGHYTFISPFSRDVRMPIIDQNNSTGPFVSALIEDEDAGINLLAYDSYLSIGEIAELWSRASGKAANYVEVSAEIMHQQFGIPKEVLDSPGFINEFGYMGGVDEFIEPFQLKKQVHTTSFENWMLERNWKEVLESINAGRTTVRGMEK
jgi:NAD(P)-dependent dehydrogenase (short-subunit alcohol dehydrogenase family)